MARYSFKKNGRVVFRGRGSPIFTFDSTSFKSLYGKKACELYGYFETYKVSEEEVLEFLKTLEEEGYVRNGVFTDTAKASEVIKEADLKDGSLYGIPRVLYELANLVFFGGRTENACVEHEGENVVHFDLSSAYAYALTVPLPDWKQGKVFKNLSLRDLKELDEEGWFGIVKGVFEDEDEELPVLPVRKKVMGEEYVFFPYGRKEGFWTSLEVALLEKGKVEVAFLFKRREFPALKESLLKLYEEKERARKEWLKVLRKGDLVKTFGLLAKKSPPPLGSGLIAFNRLVGAFVTAFVRRELYLALKVAKEYGKLLYWDTDGFLIDVRDLEGLERRLRCGKGIGRWNVKEVYGKVRFECGGAKQYAIFKGDKIWIRWKGVRLYDSVIIEVSPALGKLYAIRDNPWLGEEKLDYSSQPIPKRLGSRAFSVEELNEVFGGEKDERERSF